MHAKASDSIATAQGQAASRGSSEEIDTLGILQDIRHSRCCLTVLPPYADVTALEQRLRGHLQSLSRVMAAQAATLDPASMGYATRRSVLCRAERALAQGPGDGLRSAAEHAHELGQACRAMLDRCRGAR
ncbi:DUF6415 family natural product biosynthesis protein [Streptomyces sp. ISL-11]|uniref:DUF6415 family natural product biosynthesis protein n=1 Tax=Streptomyces sp. ISL-11 TaxID=2819174 RepID=UPI001BE85FE5|nr:DUF6415 family natural product biosynthesis protein [Streptomyces sp. ISL-11]MBT2387500.1 hypothetical protein [Streptomyces sp. ISL-11]